MKVLIAYATTEGQTRKIAEKVANQIHELGHVAQLVDIERGHRGISVDDYHVIIAAASVHQQEYQDAIEIFLKTCRSSLNAKPTMFLSVSLSAAFEQGLSEAKESITRFIDQTGWKPSLSLPVAGALRNEAYDYFQQQILQYEVLKNRIVDHPDEDHEFTDWKALAAGISSFKTLPSPNVITNSLTNWKLPKAGSKGHHDTES